MTTDSQTDTTTSSAEKKSYKVGIPRGLLYYKYAPLWHEFLKGMNCEIVYSPPTTSQITEEGSKAALSELCVPMKIYYGHIMALVEEYPDLDYIFIPRYVSTKSTQYFCPKFLILPESIKYAIDTKGVKILTMEVDAKKKKGIEGAIDVGAILGLSQVEAGKAWYFAIQKYKAFQKKLRKGANYNLLVESYDANPKHKKTPQKLRSRVPEQSRGKFPINVMLLGHAYNVYETHINMDMINRLEAMDCNVMVLEKLPKEVFEKEITINKQYHNYWENEEEIMQTARYYLTQSEASVDGIIFLISFACGPDSLIQELLMRDMKARNIPFLELVLDEHSGEAGLSTRVESFVDMIRREKYGA